MLGTGAARVVVNVDEVPDPEDEITVRPDQVVWAQCSGQLIIPGKRWMVIGTPLRTVISYQNIPWFDIVESP
ncbi:hypothetical protein A2962_04565 [Candidatus Woesebacteria bacterium RIFCSPLOWO2_01_FULL_39_61]|uniref:Uncharacterized protein n=1 Tax=Candidatus Woesebacteria bacterium RIFCSPHIGHO2_02_FULL_39_13 TaxID=1802505 RepID=A0A1F7YX78_9BACT|nr:MAG: hypothetical protein A2692_05880 [Candidatus Woesebacteria bacterium RIFCSPHIGHO2_01_FULL_39_95]OGM31942.1 MAG: hypothetical protein A3D01_00735 [Candidatus Woesebacteria bacterium RIFCSPHIGHO2_02_FULL_39_13]OGM36506.1 MAG: hypothetical protein A3E13_02510 [Candidatus Woesebacteria bacterium RIFCSPHIGHO2_12_FULL_40_20]OGM65527.1 MAG: hypothetical protein A2962_04565 [Candidatus Woesebacteria bacterium RIFCSPLOWO2_01_FULL_39_61]OGM73192.1 MAG: hypothetical protein A3H19_02030 [Candidatus